MDQIKLILGNLKKYHFWILCVIVIITGLTSWYLSTSSLKSEADKNAANIKSKEAEVRNVMGITPHPNTGFLTGMDKMIEDYSNDLGRGWRHRYAQQKGLLVWPPRLGKDFIQRVDRLRPIEEHVTYDEKGYVPAQDAMVGTDYLERYRNFITLELPTLAEHIGAKWSAKVGEARSSGGSSGSGSKMGYGGSGARSGSRSGSGSEGEEEEDDSIVSWNAANQQEILDEHFGFASEEATPHTLDVLYAQEDLWVLQAIIDVIKRTNGDADANYNAAVKEIESIQMGRTVKGRLGQITMLGQAAGGNAMQGGSAGGMGAPAGMSAPAGSGGSSSGGTSSAGPMPGGSSAGPPGGSSGGSSMGPVPGGSSMGSPSSTTGPVDPAIGRYVDIDYNPLDPKDLRAARTSQDPKQAIYSVAKRMPVRLRLRIDQRKLNDLLAECGNSSLPVEVRQVRINCDAAPGESRGSGGGFGSSGSGSSGSSMGPTPGGSSSSGSGSKSMGKSGMGMGQRGSSNQSSDEVKTDSNEIVVDIYGIVHIYNPLNQQQLNTNLREDEGAPPAAAPTESPTAAAAVETRARS
jgi:uncharacterized membrane protein YgcG